MVNKYKTLYVSDLDGTLLQSSERMSRYSCDVINLLTAKGMLFSYATLKVKASGIIPSNDEAVVAVYLMEQNGIKLRPAKRDEIQKLWQMQVEGFAELLEKYQDYDTSPATEGIDRIEMRFDMPGSIYYFIEAEGHDVGVIRIVDSKDSNPKRISPLWIMPENRGRGYAQMAIVEAERIHGPDNWSLDTILQEKGNIHLYEKMGYTRVGGLDKINDKMDIVYYHKN